MTSKPHALVEETQRFQSLVDALVAEFHRLQHSREETALENLELQKQLQPLSPRSSTFSGIGIIERLPDTPLVTPETTALSTEHTALSKEYTALSTDRTDHKVNGSQGNDKKQTWTGGLTAQKLSPAPAQPGSHDIGDPKPVEEPFHFLTPSKENGNGQETPSSRVESDEKLSSARQPGPAPAYISGPLCAKEPPLVEDVPTSFDFDDNKKNPDKASCNSKARTSLPPVFGVKLSEPSEIANGTTSADTGRDTNALLADQNTIQIEHTETTDGLGSKSSTKKFSARTTMTLAKEKAKTNWGNVLLDTIPACVILANACTIGMSADIEPESDVWDALEATWITFYFMEFLIKLLLFGPKKYYFGPDKYWNWFDFICLVISLFDMVIIYLLKASSNSGGASGLLKLLRLARLLRIVRALHYSFFDELKQMLLGVVSGVRVLIWAIILLLVVVFFMGVGLNSLYGEEQHELDTVPRAMLTVFRCYTDGCSATDGTPLQDRLFKEYGAVFFFGYILSFMFVTVGVFNLIMAIFIDNVVARSIKRKLHDLGASSERIETRVKDGLAMLIFEYAETHPNWDQIPALQERVTTNENRASIFNSAKLMDSDISISRDVFRNWLGHKEFIELLEDADVEAATKAELFDVLDVDMGGELGLDELTNGLMKLRGPITKSDIIAVRLKVRYITGMIEDIWRRTADLTKKSKEDHDESRKELRRTTAFPGKIDLSEEVMLPKPPLVS